MLRQAFAVTALLAPAIAFAAFTVEGDTAIPSQEIAPAVLVGAAMPATPIAAPLATPSKPAEAPPSPAIYSATHGITVTREGQTLSLSFTTAPAKLFVEDPTTGASVRNAKWVSSTNVRIDIGAMSQVQVRTPAGTLTVGIKGDGLVRIVDERAPA